MFIESEAPPSETIYSYKRFEEWQQPTSVRLSVNTWQHEPGFFVEIVAVLGEPMPEARELPRGGITVTEARELAAALLAAAERVAELMPERCTSCEEPIAGEDSGLCTMCTVRSRVRAHAERKSRLKALN